MPNLWQQIPVSVNTNPVVSPAVDTNTYYGMEVRCEVCKDRQRQCMSCWLDEQQARPDWSAVRERMAEAERGS
jgi:hypothetical protein